MIKKNTPNQKITLFAFEPSTGNPATGIAALLTAYVNKDDEASGSGFLYHPLADQTATEDSAVAAGYYTWDLQQSETNADKLKFSATASDPNFIVIPETVYTDPFNEVPALPPPVEEPSGSAVDALSIVRAGIPLKDNCPVLTRIKAFIVQEGAEALLEYVFRDALGNPIDLSPVQQVSESASVSQTASDEDAVLLYIREFTGMGGGNACKVYPVEGIILSAAQGVVRAWLPQEVIAQSGIYRLSWAFIRDGRRRIIQDGLLSVETTLFGFDTADHVHTDGPMTLQEVRMAMMDSSAVENQYLLDDVEFNDDQIALAITRPIQYFNATNPPLTAQYNTFNFPWKHAWIDGVLANLFAMAASHYRRNKLETADAGITASDKSKEPEYLRASELYRQRWEDFALKKKVEINMAQCVGTVSSSYSNSGR